MKKFGLRFRINFVITLVIVIFALAASDVLIEETRRSIREEIEAGTKVTVQLMETVIANTGPTRKAVRTIRRCSLSCATLVASVPTKSGCMTSVTS